MKRFINIYTLEVILLILIGLIPLFWYRSGYIALGHDMGFPLAPVDYFQDRLFAWTERLGTFGSNQTEAIAAFFIHGLEAFLSNIGLSLLHVQQVAFIFWFTLPGLTMYVLLRSLCPKKEDFAVRLSGSFFYMMNHYLLQGWMIAERTKFSIVAALPLVILAIINVIYRGRSVVKNSILISIVTIFLNGGGGIPLLGGLVVSSLASVITLSMLSPYPRLQKIKRAVFLTGLSLFFSILLNFYWIYPYFESLTQNYTTRVGATGGARGAIEWSTEISKYASFTNVIKMQGMLDWYENSAHPYAQNFLTNPFLILLSIIFPLIALVGLVKRITESRDRFVYKINFLILLLIGIPLTAGSHLPTGLLYDLALKYVPGFVMFRTPYLKFGMILWFAYAVLIALGLKNFIDFTALRFTRLSKVLVGTVILIIFSVLLAIYNYPFFTGNFFNWSDKYSTMVKVPGYIFEAKKELDKNKFSTRTLLLPKLDWRQKTDSYSWKYYSLSSVPSILSRKPFVFNDVLLQGEETPLIEGIYDQLGESGSSNLLSFIGVDRALLRGDFWAPKDSEYVPSLNDPHLDGEHSVANTIGQWKFFNMSNKDLLPLIYPSKRLSNLFISESSLSTVFNFPEIPQLGDAFTLTTILNTDYVEKNKVYQYIVEGQCLNCAKEDYINYSSLAPPRILPGNKLYFLTKLVNKMRMNKINDPSQKVDFILGMMFKNFSVVEPLIKDRKNTKVITEIINEWEESLDEMKIVYPTITEGNQKTQSGKRIYQYIWTILLKIQEWKFTEDGSPNVEDLISFDQKARSFIDDLGLFPPSREDIDQSKIRKYGIHVSRPGLYKIGVNGVIDESSSRENEDSLNETSKYLLLINGQKILLEQMSSKNRWFKSKDIRLEEDDYTILIPHSDKKTTLRNIPLNVPAAQLGCKDVPIESLNTSSVYRIKFDYQSSADRPPKVMLIEQINSLSEEVQRRISVNMQKISGEKPVFSGEFVYDPGKLTTIALIRYCTDGNYYSEVKGLINELEIIENRPDPRVFIYSDDQFNTLSVPNLEYVSLNQTKYLIRTTPFKDDFLMVFNARFDNNWKLREIDPREAEGYFKGDTKEYLGGRVIEYQRQDQHVISDLVFKSRKSDIEVFGLLINGFASSWNINPAESSILGSRRVFLLEYQIQNSVYKAFFISIISFVGLVIIYFIVKHNDKNN